MIGMPVTGRHVWGHAYKHDILDIHVTLSSIMDENLEWQTMMFSYYRVIT
jgi:hypothetical protein